MKKVIILSSVVILMLVFSVSVFSAEADFYNSSVTVTGFTSPECLTDGIHNSYSESVGAPSADVSRTDGIASVYIIFDRLPEKWRITDPENGRTIECGENGFLHEFVDVKGALGYLPKTLTLSFAEKASVSEIYGFSDGEIPSWVQMWEPPLERADLLLISSHSDDEQLFFAGVLPYYTIERGYDVQVAYIVSHFATHERPHEQLDGLWTVGVRNYPVMTDFSDLYSMSRQGAIDVFAAEGVSYDDFIENVVENIRRFKPLVVITHDINGEYGHGTHILCSSALCDAVKVSGDYTKYHESADEYGTWTPEKVYLHLYPENPLVFEIDTPLESLGGKTPFQVSQDGFNCHKTQHWMWFYRWMFGNADSPITSATQIEEYSPRFYGLYHTTVGYDTVGGDFFENVKPYAVREAEAEATATTESTPEPTEPSSEAHPQDTADDSENHNTEADEEKDRSPVIAAVVVVGIVVAVIITIAFIVLNGNDRKRRHRRRRY